MSDTTILEMAAQLRADYARAVGRSERLIDKLEETQTKLEQLRARTCRECGEGIDKNDVVYHEPCLDPMVERLQAWKAAATPLLAAVNEQLAPDGRLGEDFVRDVLPRVLRERNELRAALSEMLESFTEPEDDNDILRRARAALGR